MALNDTLDQKYLTNTFRTFHPKATQYALFSSAHGNFYRIDHTLGHSSALSKYTKIEIIPCIFSGHNVMNSKSTPRKNLEM